jgi:hypothetical protein
MDTHLHKVCQPKRASNRPLKAICRTPNDPVTPSHRAQSRIGSMYSAWEVGPSHHLLEGHKEHELSTSTTHPHNETIINRKTRVRGNSSSPLSPHTPPKPQTSMDPATPSMISAAPNPAPQHALCPPGPVVLELSPHNPHCHPHREQAVVHKSSANPHRLLYPTRNPPS